MNTRIDELLEKLAIAQLETDKQLREVKEQSKKTNQILSSIGINLGDVTEEFFYYSLSQKMKLAGIQYDSIAANVMAHKGKLQDEFDIILYNGMSGPKNIEEAITSKGIILLRQKGDVLEVMDTSAKEF